MNIKKYKVKDQNFKLNEFATAYKGKSLSKEEAEIQLALNIEKMMTLQDQLYAQNKYALFLVLQGMDTSGKDGLIKHVMKGLNPQGVEVYSFKQPSPLELSHDYLWRIHQHIPARGKIGIFNRSYYEDVLVVKVHKLLNQLPEALITENIWQERYQDIQHFEKYLGNNGIIPLKIFLHISKEEQSKRLLARLDNKNKKWKFSEADMKERAYWQDYQQAYEEAISGTATPSSPWYIVPGDQKWYARLVVSQILVETLEKLKLTYPIITKEQEACLEQYREELKKS
jgi:PPK2 family polyphosphate:nucleotide phosphotransferase